MHRGGLLWRIAAAYLLAWAAVAWLSSPSLDAYGDMVENYAWSQTWAWGSFKHPPLFAWIVRIWFDLFPTRVWAYYLLSYLNAGIGILGILQVARRCYPREPSSSDRRDDFLLLVLVFALLSAPYSNLAAKFNADTVLLSLWPWTAAAFFAAIHEREPSRRWLFAAGLGVMGAASMLGKYYSGVLLASLFIISLSSPAYRRWYATPYPYAALAVFVLLLLPHARWEMRAGFPARQYVETRLDADVSGWRIPVFVLSAIYYLPASWLAWMLVKARATGTARRPVPWEVPIRALMLLAILPAAITVAFGIFARVHLTTHWAIPIWFSLPIVMAMWLLPEICQPFPLRAFLRGVAVFWAAIVAGGLVYTTALAARGDAKFALGREAMVGAIERRFAERFPGQRLAWAGGTWPESGSVAFFGSSHPRALPGFPDEPRALVNPLSAWRDMYGVLLCFAGDAAAREGSHNEQCEAQTRAWLAAHGLPQLEDTIRYRAEGWQFDRASAKNVTVFWMPPR